MSENPSVTVLWTIENFYYCPQEENEDLSSPAFYVDTLSQSEWEIHIYPNANDVVKVFLYNVSYNTSNRLLIDYEISFLSKNGSALWTGDEKNININSKTSYEIAAYPSKDEVYENRFDEYVIEGRLTIRCRMWKSKKSLAYPILYNALTRIGVQRRIFHFQVEDISQLKITGRKITHRFRIGDEQPIFCIEFSLTGPSANRTKACIDIKQANSSMSRFFSTCKISVLNTEGGIVKESKEQNFFFDSESNIWNFPKFLTKKDLTGKNGNCLEGDVLNLLFNLAFSTDEEYYNIECVTSLPSWVEQTTKPSNYSTAKHLQNTFLNNQPGPVHDNNNQGGTLAILQKDFLTIYKDRSLSDFELRSESVSFPVHKMVLAARSPVFKAMFLSSMKERENNFMNIPDIDSNTLNKLLLFIYTGNVENMHWPYTCKLYYAADKYDVLSLKQKCSAFLSDSITERNMCEILLLADRHNDDELKHSVHDFMVHNDDKIIRSKEWKQFLGSNPVLAAETMQVIYSKKLDMLSKK